jgi:hypothetical protein
VHELLVFATAIIAGGINAVAALYFIYAGLVVWTDAIVMAAGALVGGVGGSMMAIRIGPRAVRRVVVVIGLTMAVSLMLKL